MFGLGKKVGFFDKGSKNLQMLETMKTAVDAKKRAEPFEPFILTGRDLSDLICDSVEQEPIHGIETALCIVGSMAGYAAALTAADAFANLAPEDRQKGDYLGSVAADGSPMFSGRLIDEALISGRSSFWRIVQAKGEASTKDPMPDLEEIGAYVDETMRTHSFGAPRMPEGLRCLEHPRILVEYLWPEFLGTLTSRRAESADWGLSWGFAAQDVLDDTHGLIDCTDAIKIMMECAIAMSRIDPALAREVRVAA